MVPTRPNAALARSQFEEDLATIGAGTLAKQYGWEMEPDYARLRLGAKMWALNRQGEHGDEYFLEMDMSYYRRHPPGVTFVNPDTRRFDPAADMRWLPSIASKPRRVDIAYHAEYVVNGTKRQMVCSSMVLEYYQTSHSPGPGEEWDPQRHTLFATLHLLQTMLTEPYYGGRSG